jgi:hypothetical protein
MEIFKIGAIDEWQSVKGGTEIEFKTSKARRISFEVLSNDRVEVWCSNCDGEMCLIAVVDGKAEIETTICVDAKLQIKAKKDATTMVKLAAKDQPVLVYDRNGNESMTDITPRQRENSEVMHVMRLMQANQKQREEQMMAEINKLKAGQKDEPVEVVEPVGEEPAEDSNDAEPEPKVE